MNDGLIVSKNPKNYLAICCKYEKAYVQELTHSQLQVISKLKEMAAREVEKSGAFAKFHRCNLLANSFL